MRDKTHLEQIRKWASYIKKSDGKWKKEFNEFINSQIIMAEKALKRLTPGKRRKILFRKNKKS